MHAPSLRCSRAPTTTTATARSAPRCTTRCSARSWAICARPTSGPERATAICRSR
jgi:hypothetical protein